MRAQSAVLILVLLLAACRAEEPQRGAPSSSRSVTATTAQTAQLSVRVRYDCSSAPVTTDRDCPTVPKWLVDLDRFGSFFISPGVTRPETAPCDEVHTVMATAARAESPNGALRVVAQNAALRVFARGPVLCTDVRAPAAGLVRKYMHPSGQPAADFHEVLVPWLGAANLWRDMGVPPSRRTPTLEHDRVHRFTRAFRPLRSQSVRAIVSRLVAIDTTWQPYISSVIGEVSLRYGLEPTAPACVAELDIARLGCGVELSAVASAEKLGRSPFLSREEDDVTCNRCHNPQKATGANLELADVKSTAAMLARREQLLLERARALAGEVRVAYEGANARSE